MNYKLSPKFLRALSDEGSLVSGFSYKLGKSTDNQSLNSMPNTVEYSEADLPYSIDNVSLEYNFETIRNYNKKLEVYLSMNIDEREYDQLLNYEDNTIPRYKLIYFYYIDILTNSKVLAGVIDIIPPDITNKIELLNPYKDYFIMDFSDLITSVGVDFICISNTVITHMESSQVGRSVTTRSNINQDSFLNKSSAIRLLRDMKYDGVNSQMANLNKFGIKF